ncbi:hypothetical protein [Campylobacter lari]|uniref:hypothetical protein n=1 Tax=Campylobacter lari TaxID=201 RepID=UPI0008750E24|nr:hypothetical protein [Campylobacter lari]OEV68567.1 hypothetical protein AJY52_07655 [Campylobacter lari]OEV69672.1 hypothetical protein AJY62_06140 [Campylobacter lari]OEV95269.1 hypothetical protein AJM73_01360 [Campylobacter lari]
MLNFILDLSFFKFILFGFFILFLVVLIDIFLCFCLVGFSKPRKSYLEKIRKRKNNIDTTAGFIVVIFLFVFLFSIIFHLVFSAKPDEKFINSLKENNISQDVIYNYNGSFILPIVKIRIFINYVEFWILGINNTRTSPEATSTLGFGICKRNNYNGKTCNEYLKYVVSIIKEKQKDFDLSMRYIKREEEYQKTLKEKEERKLMMKEQFELNNKNKNIENIVENSFKAKDKE